MRRSRRFIPFIATLGLLLALVAPAAAAGRIEDYARVIRSRHAGATFVQEAGCVRTEVFVSAMDAVFGSRPGPVNKQGLVGVFYRQSDICAGEGPRYPVIFMADAQSLDRLVSSTRFTAASIDVVLDGVDGDGNPAEIALDIEWSALEPLHRSKVSGNDWFPAGEKRGAMVHTWSLGLSAPAVASGSVTVNGVETPLAPTSDATLEQIRYYCQVIQHPRGGFDVDC